MALRQALQISQALAVISANGYEPIVAHGDFVVAAGNIAATDILEMAILPAGYVPLGVTVVCDDMDTGATLTFECGVISGQANKVDNARTCGNEAFASSTIGQTGGIVRDSKPEIHLLAPAVVDRGIGLRIIAGAAGLVVGARVRLTLHCRPQLNGS